MASDLDYLPSLLTQVRGLEPPQAATLLQESVAAHPGDPRLLLVLGGLYADMEAWDSAEGAYGAALQVAPDFAIARFQLGLLQLTSGRPTTAFVTWGPLDALDAKHPLRLFKEAFALLVGNRFEESIQVMEQGIANNPDNAPLNQDMHRVIGRVHQVLATRAASEESGTPTGSSLPQEEGIKSEVPVHFVLSAYKHAP